MEKHITIPSNSTNAILDLNLDEDEGKVDEERVQNKLQIKRQKKTGTRRKIKIEFIQNKIKRQVSFSKRKNNLLKKAYELNMLTGTEVFLLVASEARNVYTYATSKLQLLLMKPESISSFFFTNSTFNLFFFVLICAIASSR